MSRRGVLLDRDGTLIEDRGYLARPEQVSLLPGVREGMAELKRLGFALAVVSNQSGVARGYFNEAAVEAVNRRINELLGTAAGVDRFFFCPHLREGIVPEYSFECECRKPKPGMIERAAREMDLDLARSFLVGDARRDLAAGREARVGKVVLVLTGTAELVRDLMGVPTEADHVARDLLSAVEWIRGR